MTSAAHPWFDWCPSFKRAENIKLFISWPLFVAVRLNGKSGWVLGNHGPFAGGDLISAPIDANAIAGLYFVVFCFAGNT
jgi:hypothetical protein